MMVNAFLGKGITFPLQIDPITKDFAVSEGSLDSSSVALAYLSDAWTTSDLVSTQQNLIAESIYHIVLTDIGEYDTLPNFGSFIHNVLFDPNIEETRIATSIYFNTSTRRWEKRASIPEENVEWRVSARFTQANEAHVAVNIQFIPSQAPGNLVAPFVTPSEVRDAEFQSQDRDASGHDYFSRYYGNPVATKNGVSYNRLYRRKPIPYAGDDYPYTIKYRDTWLYISNDHYDDIRFWWIPAKIYIQDKAKEGAHRSVMNPNRALPVGETIRMPSVSRVRNQLSTNPF
jgi:phage baseplate assembly protein W